MERRIFHGKLTPRDIAQSLLAEFNRGNYRTQMVGERHNLTVQIATHMGSSSGGQTALTINLQEVKDGVMVQVGKQHWLGVAASLGVTALAALRNPFNLIGRLDDLAQDVESLTLTEKVWQIAGAVARSAGASHELSEKLSSLTCEFCDTANPVAEPNCIACGAPLGKVQPKACTQCGFVLTKNEKFCPNCGKAS
ncbi:MAG: zinc ribbon domain-containing protein [Chloroflexi bacterium]|nr:zinc ribbon domain-containing protein [Chloroflexota bacterium]